MLVLRVRAGFAAFRTFTAGAYRPTAPFLTPSAAYGLLLNLAGIEMRLEESTSVMTVTRTDLPPLQLALAPLATPEVQTIYQQLHNYPVGASGAERIPEARGNKYNIQPARREFLSGIDACIAVRAAPELELAIRDSFLPRPSVHSSQALYGLPFLGDNNFLISRLDVLPVAPSIHWYIEADEETRLAEEPVRLTVWVDRTGMARTVTRTFVLTQEPSVEPPQAAWTTMPPG